jgi:uncharacterized membrane protein
LRDDARVARLEEAVSRVMVAMIETTIVLIFISGVRLPVLLVLVPVFGGNGTAHQYAESYQGYR